MTARAASTRLTARIALAALLAAALGVGAALAQQRIVGGYALDRNLNVNSAGVNAYSTRGRSGVAPNLIQQPRYSRSRASGNIVATDRGLFAAPRYRPGQQQISAGTTYTATTYVSGGGLGVGQARVVAPRPPQYNWAASSRPAGLTPRAYTPPTSNYLRSAPSLGGSVGTTMVRPTGGAPRPATAAGLTAPTYRPPARNPFMAGR